MTAKAVLKGVLDRQGPPSQSGWVDGFVAKANWSDLQPTSGSSIVNSVVDSIVATSHSVNLPFKLRIYCGVYAPDWAKKIGGAPFTMRNAQSGVGGTCGRWWLPAYQTAYAQLQSLLAARYDSEPNLRDVVISGCSTIYDETLLRDLASSTDRKNLLRAGYTVAADKTAIQAQINAHSVWTTTPSSMAFNPFQQITSGGSTTDVTYTDSVMDSFRSTLGAGLPVIGNNSISSPLPGGQYPTMYTHIQSKGHPIYFQTATADKIGDWAATLAWAVSQGADYVELPVGYNKWNKSQVRTYAGQLTANP